MKNQVLIAILAINSSLSFTQDKVVLDESFLKKSIEMSPPTVQEIEAKLLDLKQQKLSQEDARSFSLQGEGQHSQSKEELLNNFDGSVTRDSKSYSLQLVKPSRYGVNLGVGAFANQVTNAFISNASTSGVGVSLSMDLFQNFLGRRTNNGLKKSALSVERAKLEKQTSLKTFESNLRKIYWSLVANDKRNRLLTSMVKLAKKQFDQASRRNKSGVADIGEVARYRSLWATRRASLLSLSYQKNELVREMKQLLPELNGKEIIIGPYNIDKTRARVLACTNKIYKHKKAPLQYTPYDEVIGIFEQEEALEQKVIETYDDPTIQLTGEYAEVGRSFSFQDSRDEFMDDGKARTSIGLQFNIPLGSSKRETKSVRKVLAKKKYQAKIRSSLAKVMALHTETASTINILKDVIASQQETNLYLSKSLKISTKKYKQARISVQELVSEQNDQLQSQLNEIDTNLQIIYTLMDYFSVYTDFPCELNRI